MNIQHTPKTYKDTTACYQLKVQSLINNVQRVHDTRCENVCTQKFKISWS